MSTLIADFLDEEGKVHTTHMTHNTQRAMRLHKYVEEMFLKPLFSVFVVGGVLSINSILIAY